MSPESQADRASHHALAEANNVGQKQSVGRAATPACRARVTNDPRLPTCPWHRQTTLCYIQIISTPLFLLVFSFIRHADEHGQWLSFLFGSSSTEALEDSKHIVPIFEHFANRYPSAQSCGDFELTLAAIGHCRAHGRHAFRPSDQLLARFSQCL